MIEFQEAFRDVLLPPPPRPVLFALVSAVAAASLHDLRSRRIPNPIVASVATCGVLHAIVRFGWRSGTSSAVGMLLGGALLAWQYRRGILGAGDVKLLAALGAWTGPLGVVRVLVLGSLFGGVLALIWTWRLGRAERRELIRNLVPATTQRTRRVPDIHSLPRHRGIPYGVALSIAGVLVLAFPEAR